MSVLARPTRAAAIALLAIFVAAGAAAGQELKGRALPEFTVTAPDGRDVSGAALSSQEQWLLVYLSPDSPPSHRLLRHMSEWEMPQLLARTVVVVRGNVENARAYVGKRAPEEIRNGLVWYADANDTAWSALGLHGTPMLMGVRNGQITWVLAGVLSKPESLESVVRTWIEGR